MMTIDSAIYTTLINCRSSCEVERVLRTPVLGLVPRGFLRQNLIQGSSSCLHEPTIDAFHCSIYRFNILILAISDCCVSRVPEALAPLLAHPALAPTVASEFIRVNATQLSY